ncbi:hypothetical protein [Primorskyibacter marinus]|uniref:hypothetical protein n=1 Tax=Primorskyibacter marinus TaxID=1977320 RepID=UPI000E2FF862|nr:hypothetical protein [Primorskyibacter marinus]
MMLNNAIFLTAKTDRGTDAALYAGLMQIHAKTALFASRMLGRLALGNSRTSTGMFASRGKNCCATRHPFPDQGKAVI